MSDIDKRVTHYLDKKAAVVGNGIVAVAVPLVGLWLRRWHVMFKSGQDVAGLLCIVKW